MSTKIKRLGAWLLVLVMVCVLIPPVAGDTDPEEAVDGKEEPAEEEVIVVSNDDPYSSMSADWGDDIYAQGFKYYKIPNMYTEDGGCFPEVVQAYLWGLCKARGLDYYTVVALIERESGYKYDAVGDAGNSFGYGQIYRIWHLDRMAEECVEDLTDPYGNLRVCTNFLAELEDQYGDSGENCYLMVYNMGEAVAKELWNSGVYSTEYSRGILQRAQEIKQELQRQ